MKKYIRCSEDNGIREGFWFDFGNRAIFLQSNSVNITDNIARKFINAVCDVRNVGDKIRKSALYDEATLKDFKRRIYRATVEDKGSYMSAYGKNWTMNFPYEDWEREVIEL